MKERPPHSLARCPKLGISALEKEVADLYLPLCEDDDQQTARDVSEPPKPFAAFGSFRQRHGDALKRNHMRTIEAPAKLESAACGHAKGLSQTFSILHNDGNLSSDNSTAPIDRGQLAAPLTGPLFSKPPNPQHKLNHKGKSFSTDLDREEAWERKKEQYLLEEEEDDCDDDEEYDADEGFSDAECVSGCEDESPCESDDDGVHHDGYKASDKDIVEHGVGDLDGLHPDEGHVDEERFCATHDDGIKKVIKRMPSFKKKPILRLPVKPLIRTRTKSLTDEDMDELRGSIDLGFGFSYSERCNLKSTLPALELYYAINKNYVDAQCRSSPVSPLQGNPLVRTNSAGSTSSPSNETWRISSPGDHPSQVKTRLRHWAQAVACSVKQGY